MEGLSPEGPSSRRHPLIAVMGYFIDPSPPKQLYLYFFKRYYFNCQLLGEHLFFPMGKIIFVLKFCFFTTNLDTKP